MSASFAARVTASMAFFSLCSRLFTIRPSSAGSNALENDSMRSSHNARSSVDHLGSGVISFSFGSGILFLFFSSRGPGRLARLRCRTLALLWGGLFHPKFLQCQSCGILGHRLTVPFLFRGLAPNRAVRLWPQ